MFSKCIKIRNNFKSIYNLKINANRQMINFNVNKIIKIKIKFFILFKIVKDYNKSMPNANNLIGTQKDKFKIIIYMEVKILDKIYIILYKWLSLISNKLIEMKLQFRFIIRIVLMVYA